MKTIGSWLDLLPYGIPLTGELIDWEPEFERRQGHASSGEP